MNVYHQLSALPQFNQPCILTVGNFDGVHRGHQALMKKLVIDAHVHDGLSVVFSFSNHPSEILRPETPTPLLCSPWQKTRLMTRLGIDILILLPFSREFASQTAEDFLRTVQRRLPLKKVLLGYDGRIGRNRHGNREEVFRLAEQLNFEVEYLTPVMEGGEAISSTRIRQLVKQGQLTEAESLLGRRYSVQALVERGESRGRRIGFPTANLHVEGMCLPPRGVYAVRVIKNGEIVDGIANLGVRPTFGDQEHVVLEVHLLDGEENLYGREVEVFFEKFLREEKRFPSAEALAAQIELDVEAAKGVFQQKD